MKKILVVDDDFGNLEAAEEQLGKDYNLTTVRTFSEARSLFEPTVDEAKKAQLLEEAGFPKDFYPRIDETSEETRKLYFSAREKAVEQAMIFADFDVVMTDVMMPGESNGQVDDGQRFVDQLVPVGLVIALMALKYNVPEIFVLSDTNHHNHPVAWAMDAINGGNRIVCFCGYDCPKVAVNDTHVKNWIGVLRGEIERKIF